MTEREKYLGIGEKREKEIGELSESKWLEKAVAQSGTGFGEAGCIWQREEAGESEKRNWEREEGRQDWRSESRFWEKK